MGRIEPSRQAVLPAPAAFLLYASLEHSQVSLSVGLYLVIIDHPTVSSSLEPYGIYPSLYTRHYAWLGIALVFTLGFHRIK